MPYDFVTGEPINLDKLKAFADLVRADEREKVLAAPVQEPVAWMHTNAIGHVYFRKNPQDRTLNPVPLYTQPQPAPVQPVASVPIHPKTGPLWAMTTDKPDPERLPSYPLMALYTTPLAAQRQWVGLTDEEISQFDVDPVEAKQLIAKLKEKNT